MNRSIVGYIVVLMLVVLSIVHMAVYYPILPAKVASHFDAGGRADAWTGKGTFMAFYAGTVLGTTLLMLLVGLTLPRLPKSLVNLPHKEYWLAPQREKATFASLSAWFGWFACATVALVIVCFQVSFTATLSRDVPSWLFPVVLGVYLLFCTIWCVLLVLRFRKPKDI